MTKTIRLVGLSITLIIVMAISPMLGLASGSTNQISKLGEYSGYSSQEYDGYTRVSQYVTVQQGTADEVKIAVDMLMPTKNGKVFYEYNDTSGNPVKLPVVWSNVPYHRANQLPDGTILPWLANSPWLEEVIKYGYVVAVADVRGAGASYGTRMGMWTPKETEDAYDVNEWLASQSWCTGKTGMFGYSYMGTNQLLLAAKNPPSLKAIMPREAAFDAYNAFYQNGLFMLNTMGVWDFVTRGLDLSEPPFPPVAKTDEDIDGSMLIAAIQEHLGNMSPLSLYMSVPYRDSIEPVSGENVYETRSVNGYNQQINAANIPAYHLGGWHDIWAIDTIEHYLNMTVPQKMTIAPLAHQQYDYNLFAIEHVRWYDYWLKGIQNGIMNEKPIHYAIEDTSTGTQWKSTKNWPLKTQHDIPLFFHRGNTGTVNSTNDGFLRIFPSFNGSDDYTIDYTTTSGYPTRWTNAVEGTTAPYGYSDMTTNDEKGITYTTNPMPTDVQLTGSPVVKFWVTSDHSDGNFIVYLEEIDANGVSNYLTEGAIKASHKKTHVSPFNDMNLPYHRSYQSDMEYLSSGEPSEIALDLLPISKVIKQGNRVRVTIVGADQSTYPDQGMSPAPEISIHRGGKYQSYITLPVIFNNLRNKRSFIQGLK